MYISNIDHLPTIRLLNTYASIAASKFKTTTENFHQYFREFVQAFEEADYPTNYLGSNTSTVATAYWRFFRAVDTEVSAVTNGHM
jgi:hypothetical protein